VSNSSKYGSTDPIEGDQDVGLRDAVLQIWGNRPALVFGTWRVPRPEARALVIWDKGDSPGMGDLKVPWGPSHEEVYVCGEGWDATTRRAGVIRVATLGAADARRPDHPTPKPVPLMARLIEQCPPGTIVDPFMGSGSTLRAAKDLGRRSIGIEVEERYCDLAASRLAQEVLDLGMETAA
jgi:site-specific DNA-methyltransferase (adenine-specific)